MSENAGSSESKATKLALITPSASPPRKRPRYDDRALEQSRRASTHKLATIWDSLAAKYALPVDEDDIVDMRTGKLSHDRGVLRNAPEDWRIGCFWEAQIAEADAGTDEEDSSDELDFLSSSPIKTVLRSEILPIPPINEHDEADLVLFLKDEQARKEAAGECSDADDALTDENFYFEEDIDRDSPDNLSSTLLSERSEDIDNHTSEDCQTAYYTASSSPEKLRRIYCPSPRTPSLSKAPSRYATDIHTEMVHSSPPTSNLSAIRSKSTPVTPKRVRKRKEDEKDLIEIYSSPEPPCSPELHFDYEPQSLSRSSARNSTLRSPSKSPKKPKNVALQEDTRNHPTPSQSSLTTPATLDINRLDSQALMTMIKTVVREVIEPFQSSHSSPSKKRLRSPTSFSSAAHPTATCSKLSANRTPTSASLNRNYSISMAGPTNFESQFPRGLLNSSSQEPEVRPDSKSRSISSMKGRASGYFPQLASSQLTSVRRSKSPSKSIYPAKLSASDKTPKTVPPAIKFFDQPPAEVNASLRRSKSVSFHLTQHVRSYISSSDELLLPPLDSLKATSRSRSRSMSPHRLRAMEYIAQRSSSPVKAGSRVPNAQPSKSGHCFSTGGTCYQSEIEISETETESSLDELLLV